MSILAQCWFQALSCIVIGFFTIVVIVYSFTKVTVPSISLKNANIVITGGSKGIGLEISKECLKRGANVCIVARNKQKLKDAQNLLLKQRINDAQTVLTVSADVR